MHKYPRTTFCYPTLGELSIGGDGAVRSCCVVQGVQTSKKITNVENIEELVNDSELVKLRGDLLTDKKVKTCDGCWKIEDSGGTSYRSSWNNRFKYYQREALQNVDDNFNIIDPSKIRFLDLTFGNNCNMKCVMCHPMASSQWIKDQGPLIAEFAKEVGLGVSNSPDRNKVEFEPEKYVSDVTYLASYTENSLEVPREIVQRPWYKDYDWNKFNHIIPNLQHINMVGGEPLINVEQEKLLEHIVEMGYSKNISISYNTNLSIVSAKVKKYWPQFREIALSCSFDAIGKQNDYIRYLSSWEVFTKNIFEAYNLSDNMIINFASTVSVYNILEIGKIVDWSIDMLLEREKRGLEISKILPFFTFVKIPVIHDIQILPKEIKEIAIKELEDTVNDIEKFNRKRTRELKIVIPEPDIASILIIIDMLKEEPNDKVETEKKWKVFKKFVKHLDTVRNIKIEDFGLEITKYIK